jgi:hypothetical protein
MVRQIEIIYADEFYEMMDDLIYILYSENYFGFIENAEHYVEKIYDFIENSITTYPAKVTPDKYKRYGEKYLLYNANDHTTWYIFFSQQQYVYFVQYIANNHTDFIADFNQ